MNINHSSETFVFMSDEDWELGRKFPNEKQNVLQVGKKEQFRETMTICSIINISDNCETQTTHFIYRQLFHHSSKIPWDIHLNLLFLFFFFFFTKNCLFYKIAIILWLCGWTYVHTDRSILLNELSVIRSSDLRSLNKEYVKIYFISMTMYTFFFFKIKGWAPAIRPSLEQNRSTAWQKTQLKMYHLLLSSWHTLDANLTP